MITLKYMDIFSWKLACTMSLWTVFTKKIIFLKKNIFKGSCPSRKFTYKITYCDISAPESAYALKIRLEMAKMAMEFFQISEIFK